MRLTKYPPLENRESWKYLLEKADVGHFGATTVPLEEAVQLHRALHKTFGNADPVPDWILDHERALSKSLRSCGIEHRYSDGLAEAAGTAVVSPKPIMLEEAAFYLEQMRVQAGAVKIMQGVENAEPLYLLVDNTVVPSRLNGAILRAMARALPGVDLTMFPAEAREEYLKSASALDLVLVRAAAEPVVEPWAKLAAGAPAPILKGIEREGRASLDARIVQFRDVAGSAEPEHFVLSEVLVPEEEDTQGQIYSHVDVRKTCHWWAEKQGTFAEKHILQGGRPVEPGAIVTLENYIMPVDGKIGPRTVKQGTWMLGSRVYDEAVWKGILDGTYTGYSVGAYALVTEEEVPAGATAA